MSATDRAAREGTPIVFGCLLDVHSISSGREQLLLRMRHARRIVLLDGASGGRVTLTRLRPRVIDDVDGVLRVTNVFPLSGRPRLAPIARVLAEIEGRALRRLLRHQGITQYLVWLRTPGRGLQHGRGRNEYVYDCMDPSFLGDIDPAFDAVEEPDARRAALVFATAHTLRDRMLRWNPRTSVLPNATDRLPAAPTEPVTGPLPRVVGYIGTLDARFDVAAVTAAARALPDWAFQIAGRINDPQDPAVRELTGLSNVEITGAVTEAEAIRRLTSFGIGLIPFSPRPMNDAINSVKMFDYIAFGLPVVSMDTAESRRNPFVRVAPTPHELAATIVGAHQEDQSNARRARRAWAEQNTWNIRAEQATEVLRDAGLIDGRA